MKKGKEAIRVLAPAKVNLFIEILGRRPDGFHEIATVMQAVSLFDTVTVTRRPGDIEVICDAGDVPEGRDNIAWRAAEAVLRTATMAGRTLVR